MRLVRQKRKIPKSALQELESAVRGEHHDFDTLPLVALSDQPEAQPDAEAPADGGEDIMPLEMELALEDEAPAAVHTSPVPFAQEVAEADGLNQVAGQAAMQLTPLPNANVAKQLLTLGEEERQAVLGFFQAQRREDIQLLMDQAPDGLVFSGDAGLSGYPHEGAVAPFERPSSLAALRDGSARKKRRTFFVADEITEIPKETYKGYMHDRTNITITNFLDYDLLLPHYSSNLPDFTTTFTDMCKTLCDGIKAGSEVAEKRRRLSKDVEPERAYEVPATVPSGPSRPVDFVEEPSILTEEQRNNLTLSVKQKAAGKPAPPSSSPFAPLLGPVLSPERAGLRSFSLGISPDTPVVTETVLLENAPGSMNAVVTGNQDDEDQSGNPAARIGYSSRTEKMHRFLAKEFRDSGSQDLSYEEMCRSQTEGRRDLIAGCFFELLVLKTNGVINVQQEDPQSDIKIAKAGLWAK